MDDGPLISAKSDDLPRILALAERHPDLRAVMGPFEYLPLVVDTNRVLQDVGWLARRRDQPVRNFLQELSASGLADLFAPEHLLEEVEEHLPDLSGTMRIGLPALQSTWAEYRRLIHFIPKEHLDIPAATPRTRDPDDLPFLATEEAVGARGVITLDKDLSAMGALVVKHEALRSARDFARSSSVALHGKMIGSSTLTLAGASVYGLCRGALALWRGYRRLPPWVQVAIFIGLVATTATFALHAPTRRRVRAWLDELKPKLASAAEQGAELVSRYLEELSEADNKARTAFDAMRQQLPIRARSPSLRQLAFRVCTVSAGPLSPHAIESVARRHGYTSRAKDFQKYLRSTLRKDPRLRESHGGWEPTRRVRASDALIEVAPQRPE